MIFVFFFFLGGRWFSKILRNIWGWYTKILTIPYRGRWVIWKRPKTPLRNIKMAPNWIANIIKAPKGCGFKSPQTNYVNCFLTKEFTLTHQHICVVFMYTGKSRSNFEILATFCQLSLGYFEFRLEFLRVHMMQMCCCLKISSL